MPSNNLNTKLVILGASWVVLFICIFNYDKKKNQQPIQIPSVSIQNASSAIQNRFDYVVRDYIEALKSTKWKVLRSSSNVSIETFSNGEKPIYIRTTATYELPVDVLFSFFRIGKFDFTQSRIDPFHESIKIIHTVGRDTTILKKTTKRPLIFPKRAFSLAMVESSQKTELKIALPTEIGSRMRNVTIPRGSRISSLISLKLGPDLLEKCRDSALCNTSSAGYIEAYQDFVAWFSGEDNGSRIDIVMRVDLGKDIPNWAFLATIAATGIGSMAALREMGAAALRASKAP